MLTTSLILAQLLISSTDIHIKADGQPVNDAEVNIEDCQGRAIAKKRTGPDGVVTVDFDPKLECAKIIVHAVDLESNTHTETWNPSPPERIEVELRKKPRVAALQYGSPAGVPLLVYGMNTAVSFDRSRRVPSWVAERIDVRVVKVAQGPREMGADRRIPQDAQATLEDFNSGDFSPISLASFSKNLDAATIVVPTSRSAAEQWQNYNEWFLESLNKERAEEAFIITGPLFLPGDGAVSIPRRLNRGGDGTRQTQYKMIGRNLVAVPTHLFRATLARRGERELRLLTQIIPNRPLDPVNFENLHVPTDWVEYWAGIDLWSELPTDFAEKLEADVVKDWVEAPFALPVAERPK